MLKISRYLMKFAVKKCYEVYPKMRQCGQCQKVYCKNCLDTKTIGMNKNCPNCSSNEEVLLPNQRLMILNQIFFKCQFHVNGCTTCLNMENLLSHEDTCPFQNNQQFQQSQYVSIINSSSTIQTINSSPQKRIDQKQIQGNICATQKSETEQDLVIMADFKKLQNEIAILKKICAANFKNNCNNGHQLKYESKDSNIANKVICDVCKREPTSQSVGSYRCSSCDFDRCEQCYQQNRIF